MQRPKRDEAPEPHGEGPVCPVCQTPVDRDAKCLPFCGARCKLLDLGRWLGGEYRLELPTDEELPPDEFPEDPLDPEGTP